MDAAVAAIIAEVRARGDEALVALTAQFDRVAIEASQLRIPASEIDAAVAAVPQELMAALDVAARRIEMFHRAQLPTDPEDDR